MNERIRDEFQLRVEGIVGPLVGSAGRKRQTREELIAHLQSAFEEEMDVLGDESKAVDAAVRRLGNQDELAEELQNCVPWVERIFVWIVGRKENQMSKFWIVWLVLVLIAFGLIFPQFAGGVLVGFVGGVFAGVGGNGLVRYCKTSPRGAKGLVPLGGALGFFFGMALILPALARYKSEGYLDPQSGLCLSAGILIVIAGLMLLVRSVVGVRPRVA